MRRSGSAAPHSSWSPTVNAARYSPPIGSLRSRPTGTVSVPVTAAGVSSRSERLAFVGHDLHPRLAAANRPSISSSGTLLRQLDRQRLAVAAHRADAHAEAVDRNRIRSASEDLVAFGLPFHSSRLCRCRGPCRSTAAGCRPAARPKCSRREIARCASRRDTCGRCRGSRTPDRRAASRPRRATAPICATSSRMCWAPRARGGLVGHGRHPFDEIRP